MCGALIEYPNSWMFMMYTKLELIASVRELLERHWDAIEIASKLKVDPQIVLAIIDLLT